VWSVAAPPVTGLRVGMATAAAYVTVAIPVFGVCTLDANGNGTTGETRVVTIPAAARCTGPLPRRPPIAGRGPAPADVARRGEHVAGSATHAAFSGCR
jgi:hypothetical protein